MQSTAHKVSFTVCFTDLLMGIIDWVAIVIRREK